MHFIIIIAIVLGTAWGGISAALHFAKRQDKVKVRRKMKIVVIIGAGAVGKMTVGQELAKITGLKLHHAHMDIEPVLQIFGDFNRQAVEGIRNAIFEAFAQTDNYGLITTYMYNFEVPYEQSGLYRLMQFFPNAEIYFAEIHADQSVRLKRNTTPNRLANKASKNDIDFSQGRIILEDENYRLESAPGEELIKNYFKIDNTHLEAYEVAQIIKEKFDL